MRLLPGPTDILRWRASWNNSRFFLRPRAVPPRLEELETRVLPSWNAHLLADLNVQPASSDPKGFITIGAITYFSADDGVHSRQLWRTDGTMAGTFMLKDLNPNGPGDPENFFNLNGELIFTTTASCGKATARPAEHNS